jgi:HlyD family secretion protein
MIQPLSQFGSDDLSKQIQYRRSAIWWAWYSFQLSLAIALSLVCSSGCKPIATPQAASPSGGPAGAAANDLPKVATAKPVRKDIVQRTDQPGKIESFTTTPVHAKVGGFIDKLLVEIGDRVSGPRTDDQGKTVEAGQLLAVLSAPELDDEWHQKNAQLQQTQADVEQAAAAVKVAESLVQSAEANLEECMAGQGRVQAAYDRWNSELSRVKSLVASQTVTQKLADEAQEQFKSAESARFEISAKIRSAKAKRNESSIAVEKSLADLKSIQARMNVVQAELHRVESMREYLQIRAPFSGVVTQRNVDQGFLVQPARSGQDTPLFVVVQIDRLRVLVDVPENEAGLVDIGRKAIIRIPSLSGQVIEGIVSRTSWALQTPTRALRCEIDIPNESGIVRPGMYANVELLIAERTNAIVVPKGTVIQRDGQSICLSVDSQGIVVRKPVSLGIRSAQEIEITSGLDGTENLISANTNAFKEGQKVQKAQ